MVDHVTWFFCRTFPDACCSFSSSMAFSFWETHTCTHTHTHTSLTRWPITRQNTCTPDVYITELYMTKLFFTFFKFFIFLSVSGSPLRGSDWLLLTGAGSDGVSGSDFASFRIKVIMLIHALYVNVFLIIQSNTCSWQLLFIQSGHTDKHLEPSDWLTCFAAFLASRFFWFFRADLERLFSPAAPGRMFWGGSSSCWK